MVDWLEDAPVRRLARPADHADDPARHRHHGVLHLLAVQPDPRHPRPSPWSSASRSSSASTPSPSSWSCACSRSCSRRAPCVGLFALVVVFQPELRRGLERIGRVGAIGRLFAPASQRRIEHVAREVSKAAGRLSREGHGALIVLERETGLEEIAETGVMVHADLSHELLCTIFTPRTELHDGAVIIRGDSVLAAAALLPLTAMTAVRAVRNPPPRRPRDHRGHGRRRRRRVRGERPDERGRAGADRPRPLRGPARARAHRPARGAQRPWAWWARGRRAPARPPAHRPPWTRRGAACGPDRAGTRTHPAPAPERADEEGTAAAAVPRSVNDGPQPPAPGPGDRPQLAAQAGRGRPRHAAVRRSRGVAGQQHLSRARAGDGR